jgi:CBS domain containing-hemolysin-like protein
MSDLTLATVFLILALCGVVIRKTYFNVPPRELKRNAEHGDAVAVKLYRAVAFGNSLRGLLWLYIGFTAAVSIVLFSRELEVWASLLIVGPMLWISFSLIPATRLTSLGQRLTLLATPLIAWLLNYLHRPISRATEVVQDRYVQTAHTSLFEREDLVELIERQITQPDNRISEDELDIARRAVSFNDYRVADLLTPRKKIKTVMADDTVGPILIDEVHKSGESSVLVRESKKGPVIGSLPLSRLNLNSQGKVGELMDSTVYYLHENDSLSDALQAFFATNHPLFVVVNSFEEYVGIITIESIIKHLLGHVPGDEFDQYTNLAAVSARHPKKSTKVEADKDPKSDKQETPVKTDDEVIE